MKKRYVLIIVVLCTLLLSGCSGHPINMKVAKPHHNDEGVNVKYYYTLGIGAYKGSRYSLMGTHDNQLAYVIRDLDYTAYANRVIVQVWMYNVSKDPITFGIDGFRIMSPEGKTYSLDNDYQLDRAVQTNSAEYGYVTLQPGQQKTTFLYFRVPGIDFNNLMGWRFGFLTDSYLSNILANMFRGALKEKNYVWLYPAYKEEAISR